MEGQSNRSASRDYRWPFLFLDWGNAFNTKAINTSKAPTTDAFILMSFFADQRSDVIGVFFVFFNDLKA